MVPARMRNNERAFAFLLLALANLMWAGNWVTGRALRDSFDPVALNFWRWLLATLMLAPFVLPGLLARRGVLRRHLGLLALLALVGVALFQSLVYLGLRTTTAVNAVLLNSSAPLFMLLCSWAIEREAATRGQIVGMLVSLVGIFIILLRGEPGRLLQFQFHAGDGWILLAMLLWGIYSVLLKRRPVELSGTAFLFVISAGGVLMLAPAYALEAWYWRPERYVSPQWPTLPEVAGVLYIAFAASVCAFVFWNRGVAVVGANAAGFTLHLLPLFGTALAMIFLGESFQPYHAAGFAMILAGVILATRATPQPSARP